LVRCSWPTPTFPPGWRRGGPFNRHDPATFYGGDERGYTDYPTLTD
jgi:N-ethylmaleimide reductase